MRPSTLIEHTKIRINKWKGLYSRGKYDAVPPGYQSVADNIQFLEGEVKTRFGFELSFAKEGLVRSFRYDRLNEASRYIVLTSSGSLYDSLYPADPLITNVSFVDFSAVNINNRVYISFHNRTIGLAGSYIYVYEGDGPGTLRFAAGAAPSGFTLGVATSGSSGDLEEGTYLFAVAFETESGFITAPGPAIFAEYSAPGDFSVDFSNIPVGPAGTVARRILATQTIVDYNGNQFGYEFFFVPDGRIADNVTTTLTSSFFSDDLVTSADYLFDNLPLLPAALGMTTYGNKMVFWTGDHDIWFSKDNDPETFDSTNGFQTVDKSNLSSGVTNGIEFRGQFYICKRNGTYLTTNNTNDPITWGISDVDRAVGTEIFGIGRLKDARGSNVNRFFIADYSGAKVFESGSFRDPNFSYNIQSIWDRINKDYFNLVQVDHDEENQIVYIAVPLDAATAISHILVANYQEAFDRFGLIAGAGVRWSIWSVPWQITSVAINENTATEAILTITCSTGGIYNQNIDDFNDDAVGIDSTVTTHLMQVTPNWVHHFGEKLTLQLSGVGDAGIAIRNRYLNNLATLNAETLAAEPIYPVQRKLNQVTSKVAVQITTDGNPGSYFSLIELSLDAKPLWAERPD